MLLASGVSRYDSNTLTKANDGPFLASTLDTLALTKKPNQWLCQVSALLGYDNSRAYTSAYLSHVGRVDMLNRVQDLAKE